MSNKILLVGNPNVGKSVVFSRLTGVGVISSNYAGTTIEIARGSLKIGEEKYEVIDVPGTYSLDPSSKAEEVAVELLKEGNLIINVLDSTNLERNLNLTLQLIKKNIPMLLILNFWDETKHKGISIDYKKLEEIIKIPVIPVCAITGEGVNEIINRVKDAKTSVYNFNFEENWKIVGELVDSVQKLSHKHHTFSDRLSEITIHPVTGIPAALLILFFTFIIVRFIGEGLVTRVLDPLFNLYYHPFILKLFSSLQPEFLKQILIGKTGVVMESFGLLTTAVYIPVVIVFPYILAFYLVLSFLEDFGYLPRVAVIFDNIFHRLGLHGYSSIPVMLGLGCKVPALLATRILESEREKVITTVLILMSAPCMPQTAMIFSLGAKYGVHAIFMIFFILFVIAVVTSLILNLFLKGDAPELFVEIPPYRVPRIATLLNKLWFRTKGFFSEAVPMIIAGVFIINIMDIIGFTGLIAVWIGRPVAYLLNLPENIVSVMLMGFLRKDVSIALLAPLGLNAKQFIVSSIFLVLYLPCIASFFTLLKEMGAKVTFKITFVILTIAFCTAFILNRLL
ncbi:MAG: ferrous iron transporter B [Elusimicrobia bacterium RIFOXYA2_FULL_40_6]|nr:MAG: ferrous iron transporter B [Elusimicrobia bacterium RIFOXYA2_FULL_40_6]